MGYKSKNRTPHTGISKEAFNEMFNIVRSLAIAIRKVQLTITLQFPLTFVRMATIKTTSDS